MISKRISKSKDIPRPPKMKIFNMVIPILMHFYSLDLNLSVASHKNAAQR